MSEKIMSFENAPAGTRVLTRGRSIFDKPAEATVVEWSPRGRLKIQWANSGYTTWLEGSDIPLLVEVLP